MNQINETDDFSYLLREGLHMHAPLRERLFYSVLYSFHEWLKGLDKTELKSIDEMDDPGRLFDAILRR